MKSSERTCSLDGCNEPHAAKGWCSVHYQRALRNNGDPTRPPVRLECPRCGSVFERAVHNQLYCSRRCFQSIFNRRRYEANKQVWLDQNNAWRMANRERRNATDRARYATNPERYRMRDTRRKWEQANRDKARSYRRRRAARLRAVPFEDFTDQEIFERDGWICQLCGERVDRRTKFPHPRSATLDHIGRLDD